MRLDHHPVVFNGGTEGTISPRGLPLTRPPGKHRKLGTATGRTTKGKRGGRVEGTVSRGGDCTLTPLRMPPPLPPQDSSVRLGWLCTDGTIVYDTETTAQRAQRRKEEAAQRALDAAERQRRITAIPMSQAAQIDHWGAPTPDNS